MRCCAVCGEFFDKLEDLYGHVMYAHSSVKLTSSIKLKYIDDAIGGWGCEFQGQPVDYLEGQSVIVPELLFAFSKKDPCVWTNLYAPKIDPICLNPEDLYFNVLGRALWYDGHMAPFCANDFVDPVIDSPSSVVLSIKDEPHTPTRDVTFEELCESFVLADKMFGKQNGLHSPFEVVKKEEVPPTEDEIAHPTDAPAPEAIGKDGLPYFASNFAPHMMKPTIEQTF